MPDELVESISTSRVAMIGTDCKSPRCVALVGEVGVKVSCSIYGKRATTSREYDPVWEDGVHNSHCDAARAAFGLPPVVLAAA